ncbi:excalibur calcium-binding domain-containing protein [Streptomyces sp. SLBN-118]|uniref:excalibur calcium-binding domain-containing protein n=1 Tax=Streptomyces sp. SLBN-118 TaxID=2768454 RepID=UPI0011711F84|nr:excalibur calcium-binding domain-containing protein [Streptomyces sp. SLBN-118]TQK44826.1 excalibur calcium-binding domain-containing protein [Streptomyces sp. SLBN-118]
MALGVVGCGSGGQENPKSLAATAGPATTTSAAPTPSVQAALGLVDDQESADAGKAVEVKVLGNDSVTLKDGRTGNVETALTAGQFTISVDTAPVHGTATVDGSVITYTSSPGYGGGDEFTYRVDVAGQSLTGTAVVRITVTAPKPTPKPAPKPPKPAVSYANCDAVRAAGADPIHKREPGYGTHLDRDRDGVGCESWSGGSGTSGGSTAGSTGGSTGGGGGSTYYANCSAVRAAGAAPIHAGEPGYGRHLDRDGDGVGCE